MDKKKELYREIERHILNDKKPSVFLNEITNKDVFKYDYPFTMLWELLFTKQNKKYHPEGSVWNHTLLVVDEAAKRKNESKNPDIIMWASLLHDIGKGPTTRIKDDRIVSYNHEKYGESMSVKFLSEFTEDMNFIREVSLLVRWHMEPLFMLKKLPFSNVNKMVSEVSLEDISILSICDRLGRGNMSKEKADEEIKGIEVFIDRCKKIISHGT